MRIVSLSVPDSALRLSPSRSAKLPTRLFFALALSATVNRSWFDATGCRLGLSRLAGYHRNKSGKPAHDDNCHGADALRTAADGLPLVTGMSLSRYSSFSHPGPLRRRLRGVV